MIDSRNCLPVVVSVDCIPKTHPTFVTDTEKMASMPSECSYRIVLADDHPLFRSDLKRICLECGDLQVVGEACNCIQLVEIMRLAVQTPHMAIVDTSMPRVGGIESAAALKRVCPWMKVLIVSMHREREYVQTALCSGADGYLLKKNSDTELLQAIAKIRQGGVYVSPHLSAV